MPADPCLQHAPKAAQHTNIALQRLHSCCFDVPGFYLPPAWAESVKTVI